MIKCHFASFIKDYNQRHKVIIFSANTSILFPNSIKLTSRLIFWTSTINNLFFSSFNYVQFNNNIVLSLFKRNDIFRLFKTDENNELMLRKF